MTPTLLVLAAGMGSRYGGLKQIDPMGPNGETLLDYSLTDAQAAGFQKIVFVIRRDFHGLFQQAVGDRYAAKFEVHYAFQDLEDLPEGFQVPHDRTKPWGTAHAIRSARSLINDPFVAINADDYYGADAYEQIAGRLPQLDPEDPGSIALVGYPIENTLSPSGGVNRGICRVENGMLQSVEEHSDIVANERGEITGLNLAQQGTVIPRGTLVSMNFWAFTPAFFQPLDALFAAFLRQRGEELKSECYIPSVVDRLIRDGAARCQVISTTGEWFGVTYPEDKPLVQKRLAERRSRLVSPPR